MKFEPYRIKSEIVVTPNENSTAVEMTMYFVCDGLACENCNKELCYLTTDIKHAKRFDVFD